MSDLQTQQFYISHQPVFHIYLAAEPGGLGRVVRQVKHVKLLVGRLLLQLVVGHLQDFKMQEHLYNRARDFVPQSIVPHIIERWGFMKVRLKKKN